MVLANQLKNVTFSPPNRNYLLIRPLNDVPLFMERKQNGDLIQWDINDEDVRAGLQVISAAIRNEFGATSGSLLSSNNTLVCEAFDDTSHVFDPNETSVSFSHPIHSRRRFEAIVLCIADITVQNGEVSVHLVLNGGRLTEGQFERKKNVRQIIPLLGSDEMRRIIA